MKNVLIIPNQFKDKKYTVTKKIIDWLGNYNINSYLPKELQGEVELEGCHFKAEAEYKQLDVCLVLGGDGSIIQTGRRLLDKELPILGINLGNLGFLAEIELSDLEHALQEFIDGNYVIEDRMLISACKIEGEFLGNALNDIVVSRQSISRMINFDVHVNGDFVNSYRADGVIVSTPTGSTAYNLSAGGPIISPNNKVIVMTPICPHSLTARSMVFSSRDEIEITFKHPRNKHVDDLLITIDGQETTRIYKEDSIKIKRTEKSIALMRLVENDFYTILRKKL